MARCVRAFSKKLQLACLRAEPKNGQNREKAAARLFQAGSRVRIPSGRARRDAGGCAPIARMARVLGERTSGRSAPAAALTGRRREPVER
jgi:hypothetical protein